jgi:hypothetical protein
MDRELLNVEFSKKVKIKKLKPADCVPDKPKRNESQFYQKCIKLAYFILMVIVLFWGIRWGVVATVNFCESGSLTQPFGNFDELWTAAKAEWKEENP